MARTTSSRGSKAFAASDASSRLRFHTQTGGVTLTAQQPLNNVVHWSDFDEGGHFAAMERPDLLAADLRSFTQTLQTLQG